MIRTELNQFCFRTEEQRFISKVEVICKENETKNDRDECVPKSTAIEPSSVPQYEFGDYDTSSPLGIAIDYFAFEYEAFETVTDLPEEGEISTETIETNTIIVEASGTSTESFETLTESSETSTQLYETSTQSFEISTVSLGGSVESFEISTEASETTTETFESTESFERSTNLN